MKTKLKRVSFSLPSDLLNAFEKILHRTGFSDRSKGLQVAMRNFISENKWLEQEEGSGAGTLMILYDPHSKKTESLSTKIQHEFGDLISASIHVHLDHHNCLETIMVKGKFEQIKILSKRLSEDKAIKNIKVNFVKII